jgi:hypothetical protein
MWTKTLLATFSLLFSLAIYIPYYHGIWKKETKPHLLSWLTWFLLTALGFVLSYSAGGGLGSFTFALQSFLSLTIVIYALYKKEKNIVRFDWVIFGFAIIILLFYLLTKNALWSVIFAGSIDCLGYVPTFRKSYLKPFSEPVATHALACASWIFSVGALSAYTPTTLIYPLSLVFTTAIFVIFLFVRQKITKKI